VVYFLLFLLFRKMIKDAPDGWEDESGFHFGKQDKNSQPKADPPLAEKDSHNL
jgi:hypothetical protein